MKKLFMTSVAVLLILTMLVNMQMPIMQARAESPAAGKAATEQPIEKWESATSIADSGIQNTLPDLPDNGSIPARKPDIGDVKDGSINPLNWLSILWSGNIIAESKGNGSKSIISDNGIKVSSGRSWVELAPASGSFKLSAKSDKAVRYTNVFDGIDYQFASVDGTAQIKVFYEKETENNSFEFNLGCSDGLETEPRDGGFVISKNGKEIFTISAPVAKDIGGAEGEVELSVSENGKLILSVDDHWLHELSRAYPVSVGFCINKFNGETPIVLNSAYIPLAAVPIGDNGMGNVRISQIGGDNLISVSNVIVDMTSQSSDGAEGGETSEQNIIIVSFEAEDGSGANFTQEISMPGDGEATSGVEGTIIPAVEGNVVWQCVASLPAGLSPDSGDSQAQSDIGLYTLYNTKVNIDGVETELDKFLIYYVQRNLTGESLEVIAHHYGVPLSTIEADNALNHNDLAIRTGSTLILRNAACGGKFIVGTPTTEELNAARAWLMLTDSEYMCQIGLEPINFNTGNYINNVNDVRLPDYSGYFEINRKYNSIGSISKGVLGYGWSFDYDVYLYRKYNGDFRMQFGDGGAIEFHQRGSSFIADEGKNYSFQKLSSGYAVTNDQTKEYYRFDNFGHLSYITDVHGNQTSLAYSNFRLSSITTSAGYVIGVTNDSSGRITILTLPDGKEIRYLYDGYGNLASVTDQEGRTTSYTYDSAHRLLSVTNPNGTTIIHNTYDSFNRVVKQIDANGNTSTLSYMDGKTIVTDNNGNITQIFYDGNGRTVKVINADGSEELNTWDSANNMTSHTDELGITTYYEYNTDGLLTKEIRADGASSLYTYDSNNNVISYTDFAGNTTTYAYDNRGNKTAIIYADGNRSESIYNSHNQLIEEIDQLGNATHYEYTGALCTAYIDAEGNRTEFGYSIMGWLTAYKDAAGNITRYLNNACGEVYGEQRPDGSVYTYIYDDAGLVIAVLDEFGNETSISYDNQGNAVGGTDPLGNSILMTYDANHNKITSTDALGRTTRYSYDSMNRVTTVTDPNGGVLVYVYDAKGKVVAITDPNGNTATIDYDNVIGLETVVTEPGGRITSFNYDLMGNPIKITTADGSVQTFQYDSLYRLTKATSALGLVTDYTYDAVGNMICISNSEGQTYTYNYDKVGNITKITDALGNSTLFTYDALGRVIASIDSAGLTSTTEYDCMSRPVRVTDPAGNSILYEYNLRGEMTGVIDVNGNRTELYYDAIGNLIATRDVLGNVTTYEYDAAEQLIKKIDALSNATSFAYDSNGEITKITDANGGETTLSYDNNGNNTRIVDAEGYISDVTYNYADQIVKTIAPTGLEKNFTYDSMCRIVKATDSTGGFIEYTYDAEGNILTETDAIGRVSTYTYDTLGRMTSHTGYDGETYTYSYDAIGRLETETTPEGKTTTYTYDYRNNPVKITEFDGSEYIYEYDVLGRLIKTTNPIGAVINYEYDAAGYITKSTDAEGNVTSVSYDALERIASVTQANSGVNSYTYDAVGNVISSTSPLGNVSEYQYDSVYNLIAYKDSENYITTYTYDLVGNMTSVTSARNAVTQYQYDGAGNVTKVTDALGNITAYEYTADNIVTKMTQANGGTYLYEYDVLDRVTKVTDPEGYFRAFTYNVDGDISTEIDSLDKHNTFTYDIMHRMTSSSEEGNVTAYSYDARGNLAQTVYPNNATYSYTYDAIDRLSAMTDPLGLDIAYTYDLNNRLISETKENAATTSYSYDSMGNNISVTDPMGAVTQFVYDIENNLTSTTDPLGGTVSAVYDTLGRTTSLTDQLGETVALAYDPHSNIVGLTDAKAQTTTYTYDLVDNLTGIVDANGAVVSYAYDGMGNLISATNGNGKTSAYTYNLRGDLTSVTSPLGQVEQYRYDISGKLTEYEKPSGITISYDYDKLNNLIQKTADDETPVAYAFDNMGFRTEMNDDIGEVTYEYDAVGNATKIVHHNGDTVRYTYDVFGRLSEIMYPDGYCTDYAYDLCDRLVTVTGRDGGITTYQYDANGNVTRCDRSNSTYTTYTYNARNELISLENRRANSSNTLLSSYVYEYDQNGYITKETEHVDSYTYVRTYTYDAVGQLTGYIETTNGQQTAKYEYSYDAAGNRTGMVYFDASNTRYWTDYVYDDNNELVTETYNYRKNKNKIISTVTTYTYDTDGDLVTKNVGGSEIWQYLWTAESRLEAVTKGGTLLMAATYDGDNNRIFQISDAASSSKVHQDNQLKKEWKKENGNSYPWENGNGNGGNGTGHSNTGNGSTNNGGQHNHIGNNSDGLKHANCKQCLDEQEAFVQSLADDAVTIDGVDYLPVGKPNSYKDYELIYYINDVTIANEEVLVEYGANGTATGTYEYGLQRLSVEYVNEAKEYYLYNGTGNVTQTTAQNGSMFLRYTYDPFGNVESINAPMTVDIDDLNRYTYNGEDYDFNTGLQYLRARYYNTSTGNFISQDTYLGSAISAVSLNRYTYTGNSPVMFSDPSGNWSVLKSATEWLGNKIDHAVEAVNDFKASAAEAVVNFAVNTYNDAKTFVENTVDSAKHASRIASCKAQAFILDPLASAVTTAKATAKFVKENAAEIAVVAGTAAIMAGATVLTAVCPAAAPITGGVMAAGMDLIGQITSGKKVSDVDWVHVGLSGVSGTITSTLTFVGAGPLAMSVSGAITGGGMELYNQYKQGAPINWGQVAISAVGGAASGAIAGKINKISKTASAAQKAGSSIDCDAINKQIKALDSLSVASNFAESTAYKMAGGDSFGEAITSTGMDFVTNAATDYGISKLNRLTECFCFIAGTPVLTAAGLVAIETINVGDIVIATDPETGETAEKEVKEVYVNQSNELIHLTVNGEEITTTPAHPFFVPEKGWTSAIELRAGDILVLVNGEYVTVEAVQHEILEAPVTVYNFQVNDFHTYYVGKQSVLVHNMEKETSCGLIDQTGVDNNKDSEIVIVEISREKYPESAKHIEEAIASGQPEILTINRSGAAENRRKSLAGVGTIPGMDRDEYPPAMFSEGGAGADVKHITSSDNRGAGSSFGAQLRGYKDGTKVKFLITEKPKGD